MKLMSKKALFKFISVFIITISAQSQKLSQNVVFSYQKQYPHQLLKSNSIGIIIDEKACDIIIKDGNQNKVIDLRFISNQHQEISSLILNYLNFSNLQIVEPSKSDYTITYTSISPSYEINTGSKQLSISDTELKEYYSEISYNCGVIAIVKDNDEKIIFEKTVSENVLLDRLVFKEINDEKLIFNKTLKLLKSNQGRDYIQQRTEAFFKATQKVSSFINDEIGVYEKKEEIYFYKIGKKKGFDFETINKDIDVFRKIGFIDLQEKNQYNLIAKVKEALPNWNSKLSSIDPNNKKNKKVLWAMQANIAAGNYIIRNYNTSLEIAEKTLNAGYRKDYLYLKEFPKEKIDRRIHFEKLLKDTNKLTLITEFNNRYKSHLIDYQNTNPNLISISKVKNHKKVITKSKYLYNVFASLAYFNKLKSILKEFAEKDETKLAGFKTKDAFFVYVLERLNKQAKELKYTDVKLFEEKEKVLISKINIDISTLYNVLFRELSIDTDKVKVINPLDTFLKLKNKENVDINNDELHYVYQSLFKVLSIDSETLTNVNKNVKELSSILLKSESTTLQKLPYLEVLFSELTDENKLNIQENEKLYTLIFKEFKKVYANIFFNKSEISKYIHHREVDALNSNLKFYEEVYKTTATGLRNIYQNESNEDRVLQTLLLFIK